jgi:hypothetical protein
MSYDFRLWILSYEEIKWDMAVLNGYWLTYPVQGITNINIHHSPPPPQKKKNMEALA